MLRLFTESVTYMFLGGRVLKLMKNRVSVTITRIP